MSASGFVAWVCRQDDTPDPAVSQTLQDYGGMNLASEGNQDLWFFFNADLLLALARLTIWAKFNEVSASVAAFPAKLVLGGKREIGLEVETSLSDQSMFAAKNLEIWLHPKLCEHSDSLPGISFQEKAAVQGMAKTA